MATAPSPNDLTRQQLDELDALLQRMLSLPLTTAELPGPPLATSAVAPPLPPGVSANWRVDAVSAAASAPAPHLTLAEAPSSGSIKIEDPPPLPPLTPPQSSLHPPGHKPAAPATSPTPAAPTSSADTAAPYPPAPPPSVLAASATSAAEISWPVTANPTSAAASAPPLPPTRPAAGNSRPAVAADTLSFAPSAVSSENTKTSSVSKPPRPLTPPPATPPIPVIFWPLIAITVLFDAFCGVLGPPGRVLRSPFCKQLYGVAGIALLLYTGAYIAQVNGWLTLPVQLPWPE